MKKQEIERVSIKINNVKNFRKIFEFKDGPGVLYSATVSIVDLYKIRNDLNKVLNINPRNQKSSSKPSRSMEETLIDSQDMFVFRNRGLTFISKDLQWNNSTDELILEFELTGKKDEEVNGLADGGHTYQVLMNYIDQVEESARKDITASVRFDIIIGFNHLPEEVNAIVEARNTSTQVREDTLLNKEGVFEPLKDALKGTEYEKNIAYYENQYVDESDPSSGFRQIKVSTILSYLMCFDIGAFSDNTHPVVAYSSKSKSLEWYKKYFEKRPEDLVQFLKLAKTILNFHDVVESQVPKVWNKYSGRYADQPGVKPLTKPSKLLFTNHEVSYNVPGGHVYPIMAAFRALIIQEKGVYQFRIDPEEFILKAKDLSSSLVLKIKNSQEADPQKLGKNSNLYGDCYSTVGYMSYKYTER